METGCHTGGFRQVLIISLPVTAGGEKCIIVLLSRGENIMYRKGKSYRKSSLIKSRRRQQSQFGPRMYTPREKLQNRIRLEMRMTIHQYNMIMQEEVEKG